MEGLFFPSGSKLLHRHIYVDAKKLPEGRRKNNVPDLELDLVTVTVRVYQAPVLCQSSEPSRAVYMHSGLWAPNPTPPPPGTPWMPISWMKAWKLRQAAHLPEATGS